MYLQDVDDKQYAHIANAAWTMLMATGCEYQVELDEEANRENLDKVWTSTATSTGNRALDAEPLKPKARGWQSVDSTPPERVNDPAGDFELR